MPGALPCMRLAKRSHATGEKMCIRDSRKVPLALGGVVTLLQGGLFVRQGVEALPGEGQLIPYASGVGGGQGVSLGEHAPGRFFGQHGWQGLLSGAPMG